MAFILDFFAATHSPHLHARGAGATDLLLNALRIQEGQRILEIGFGTGQTLVEIAARWPGVALFGVEKSPRMLATARRRLRFCGLNDKELHLLSDTSEHEAVITGKRSDDFESSDREARNSSDDSKSSDEYKLFALARMRVCAGDYAY
jgi:SAM-dependent methyltransferase